MMRCKSVNISGLELNAYTTPRTLLFAKSKGINVERDSSDSEFIVVSGNLSLSAAEVQQFYKDKTKQDMELLKANLEKLKEFYAQNPDIAEKAKKDMEKLRQGMW